MAGETGTALLSGVIKTPFSTWLRYVHGILPKQTTLQFIDSHSQQCSRERVFSLGPVRLTDVHTSGAPAKTMSIGTTKNQGGDIPYWAPAAFLPPLADAKCLLSKIARVHKFPLPRAAPLIERAPLIDTYRSLDHKKGVVANEPRARQPQKRGACLSRVLRAPRQPAGGRSAGEPSDVRWLLLSPD
ncbi:hypothetical protein CMEL01_08769 [Colletotrichum melonis]|uniref:Uncharacterized protein n=1 Tax=Colletotrichum melonis TaxID=1209925 RepID=A0AAI9U2Q7_9PEZI|nr:hypothetical protein CMEL01_08769 [Colletotrichum melonis]